MKARDIVLASAVVGLFGTCWYYRAAASREHLRRVNVEAEADSTHHFLRGQLQVATRLVVQRPLAHKATATVTIEVPGATITKTDTLLVGDTLHATLDTNGVTVRATVALLPPPPTWTWNLTQQPLAYRVTFEGCHDHAARVSVEGPRWQAVQLVDLQQDPNICNPPPGWTLFSVRPPSLLWVGLIAGATYLLMK